MSAIRQSGPRHGRGRLPSVHSTLRRTSARRAAGLARPPTDKHGKDGAMDPVVATVVRLYKEAHDEMRKAVRDTEPAALTWRPAPETNSIAVLIVHTLGSEAEVFRIARNAP